MPIVKIYGFEEDKDEMWNLSNDLTEGLVKIFGENGVGIVIVYSNCFVCGSGESYKYLEILYRKKKDLKKIMGFLKKIKVELDVVSIKLLKKGFVSDQELK